MRSLCCPQHHVAVSAGSRRSPVHVLQFSCTRLQNSSVVAQDWVKVLSSEHGVRYAVVYQQRLWALLLQFFSVNAFVTVDLSWLLLSLCFAWDEWVWVKGIFSQVHPIKLILFLQMFSLHFAPVTCCIRLPSDASPLVLVEFNFVMNSPLDKIMWFNTVVKLSMYKSFFFNTGATTYLGCLSQTPSHFQMFSVS